MVADGVAGAELDEGVCRGSGCADRIAVDVVVVDGGVHPRGERLVALEEHRVVDLVLGGEVRIDRLRPHADPLAEVAHRQPGETVLADDLPARLDDLPLCFLTAFGSPVAVRFT